MKKGLKIALIVAGSLIALLLAVNLLAGPIAKSYVEKHDQELIGREVSIEKLHVNLFLGKVKINDLVLYEDDGETPFLRLDHFEINVKLRDLLSRRLFVRNVLFSGLKVNVEQDRSWFNFSSLIEHFSSDEPKDKKSDFGLIFNDVNIKNSLIHYTDLAIGSDFLLRNLSLRIPYIDLSNLKTDVGLDVHLSDSAKLHTDLHLSENAEEYFINLNLSNLGIDIVEPYLKQSFAVDSLQGRLDFALSAQGRTEHILDFDLTGDVSLNDISLQDTLGQPLGRIDSIGAQIGRFNLSQNLLDFERVYLSGLDAAYVLNADSTTNFDILRGKKQYQDTTVFEKVIDTIAAEFEYVQENNALKINIQDLHLDHAHLMFEDHTLPEVFHYEISDITLNSKNFNLDGSNTVQFNATLNHAGKLNVVWQGNLHGLENHDLTLMLNNVKFNDFSPYAMQLFGYPIEQGTLSFQSQNKIVDSNLEGFNKLQLASPRLGKKMKQHDAPYDNVPLKLGIFLLTDKNRNVNLELPVSGNLNDPKFSYRKTLFKALNNLLIKVATSPFRLLASDGNLQYIPFEVLQSDFSAAEYTMIDDMAATLTMQPNLCIELEAKVNYDEFIKQLSVMQLQRDYYLSEHPEVNPDDIDFLTDEAIRSIKLNDKGLHEYATQYSEKKRLNKKDVESVAYAVYHEPSEQILTERMERYNEMLSNYLLNIKGLSSVQVAVTPIDEAALKSYDKASRYELHVTIQDDENPSADD